MGTQGNTVLVKNKNGDTLGTATVYNGNEAVTDASDLRMVPGRMLKAFYINGVTFTFDRNTKDMDGDLVSWVFLPTIGSPTDSGINKLTIYND